MTIGIAAVNLGSKAAPSRRSGTLLPLLLKVEAWLDRRASRRALYRLDDRALADIGLSRADVDGIYDDPSLSPQSLLLIPDVRQERV